MDENIHTYRQVFPVGHSQEPDKKITPEKKAAVGDNLSRRQHCQTTALKTRLT